MSILQPDLYYRGVCDIDLELLLERGIDTLLLDIDNTVLPRDSGVLVEGVSGWARMLHRREFKCALVSNNWHDHVRRIADDLGFEMVSKALKPLPFAFFRAAALLGSKPKACAVIGDQIFTDILGGNLSGMTTVLVQPLSVTDLPHTLVLRRIERRILSDRVPLS